MAAGVSTTWDKLEDFQRRDVRLRNLTRAVYVAGAGPGVIIMHEVPGITPEVARFARWVRDAGFRVYLPSLLGAPGKPNSAGYALQSGLRACVAREFSLWAADNSSPIVDWLKDYARDVHGECGGKGVGALGMCLTGNFALSMMVEPAVRAPVLCQPSLPLGKPAGVHATPADLAAVRARLDREDLTVRCYRFDSDHLCRAARFEALQAALGDRFVPTVLADADAKAGTFMKNRHSVVTTHLIDEAGSVTRAKVDEIIAFFRQRLM